MRRLTAPAKARPPAVASPDILEADANRLIASFRLRAYSEARRRQRQAQATPAAAHWAEVARLIAQRRGESREAKPPSRQERDVALAGARETLPAPRPIRFFEVDPLDELERVLALKPQRFRLQFFGVGPNLCPLRPHRNRDSGRRRLRRDPRRGRSRLAAASGRLARARPGGSRDLRAPQGGYAIVRGRPPLPRDAMQ